MEAIGEQETALSRARALALVLLAGSCGACRQSDEKESADPTREPASLRQNVIILLWDTVRADRLSCYGYPVPTTPRLDRFAEQATVFERAIAPGIWTLPSHASLFTGLPMAAHGVSSAYAWLNEGFETLAETFARAGYSTYAFSANPHITPETNLAQGFEVLEHPWDPEWSDRFTAEVAGQKDYRNAGEVAHEAFWRWLDSRKEQRPFFAFINYMEAHVPRWPSREARERVLSGEELARAEPLQADPYPLLEWMLAERACSDSELELVGGLYDAALVDLDRRTGLLLDELERRGLMDRTVVVLTSDHGENLGERRLFDHKFCAYDTLLRVPLIVRVPGRLAPGRVGRTVSLLDVHASLLELAGTSAPNTGMLGVSLWSGEGDRPVCAQELSSFPKLLLKSAQELPSLDLARWSRTFQTIERDGVKLIRNSDGATELYDVRSDPAELENLSASDPDRVRSLSGELDRWLASFPHLDPATQVEEHRRALPADVRQHLRALGYYDQE